MTLPLSPGAAKALALLRGAGYEAWIVGGCVRDALLGLAPKDYDLATSALPEQTKAVFAGRPVVETGLRHGTVTVLLEGEPLEITTYRVDGAYSDARHPDEVTFTRSLREDAARRDFTINAMAYAPGAGLQDFFGGREDLARGLIRAVGTAEQRFREDALRILRALRFAAVLDFTLEGETDRAARACAPLLAGVSAERVSGELGKLLCGKAAGRVLREYPNVLGVCSRRSSPWWAWTTGTPTTATTCGPTPPWRWTTCPRSSPCAWPCSSTTSASRTPSPWGRTARATSMATPGAAWSWRRKSSPGCGFPGAPGSGCSPWCATTTPSWRRPPSGSAGG